MRFNQTIITRYLGPTNTQGPRIKATANAASIVVKYDSGFSRDMNDSLAAFKLASKLDWLSEGVQLHGGSLPNNKGHVFVLCDESSRSLFTPCDKKETIT